MKKRLIAILLASCLVGAVPQILANPFDWSLSTGKEEDVAKIAQDATTFANRQPEWARPFMVALYREGEWGAVLNLNRLGLAAMEKRQFGIARKSFDMAIDRVESIYANDPSAAQARSVFNSEKAKDFKGEPYERAMMYYYRGLLYLQDGDYQNARAAFLAADRHDTLSSAEIQAYAGDFGMMKYLAGWASNCDGDGIRAGQLIQEARAADSAIRELPDRPTNSIVLIDAGPAPVKWGDGQHKQILKFKPGEGEDGPFVLRLASGENRDSLLLAGDVNYQAATRGGRAVDGIIAGKAQFKDTANAVGETAVAVGAQVIGNAGAAGDRSAINVGLAGVLFGIVSKGMSMASNPEADVRAWDTLPARVLLRAEKDIAHAPVKLVSAGAATELPVRGSHGACSFAWGRTRSALAMEMGGSARINSPESAESYRGDRNRAFRVLLTTEMVASN